MLAISLFIQLLAGEARCPEDACLRGIAFIDASRGWTVGDDGAIWRTTDGGAHWERQSGGTRGTLRKVVFQ
ncbi:MAG: YCF48-related protein, partial [Planctomycetota bacterium]